MDNPCKAPGGCTCGEPGNSGDSRAIENDVFSYVRRAFEFRHLVDPPKFHFVLLDSQDRRVVSLGMPHDSSTTYGLKDIDRRMKEFAGRTDAHQWKSDMLGLLRASLDGFFLPHVYGWACHLLENQGQPLGVDLSRFEQCLVSEVARSAGLIEAKPQLPQHVAGNKHLYFIDNYLKLNEAWGEEWKTALHALGCERRIETGESRMETANLLVFLAECMQFWKPGELADDLVNRLKQDLPGIAILPFRILGQYRAAAVWFYTGSIHEAKNKELKTAIQDASRSSDWLPPTVESALLYKTVFVVLDALYNQKVNTLERFLDCHRARRALADLWYAKKITFKLGTNGQAVKGGTILSKAGSVAGPVGETRHETVTVRISDDPDVIKFFGFDSVEFEAPLMAKSNYIADAVADVEEKLRPITSAVQRVRQREIEVQKRVNMSVTAHDFSNALKDLQALSADWNNDDGVSDRDRLMMINRRAHQLTGNAYIMRKRARDDIRTENLLPEILREPTMEDARFWERFIRSMTLVTTFAQWRLARPRSGHVLALHFKFQFELTTSENRYEPDPTVFYIGKGGLNLEHIPDILHQNSPVWPLEKDARDTHGKLSEYGQIALMLWGPFELLRNAGQHSVRLLRDRDRDSDATRSIHFDMTMTGAERRCHIKTRVENDCFSTPPEIAGIASLQRIAEALPKYSFVNESKEETPERARYLSELVFGDMGGH